MPATRFPPDPVLAKRNACLLADFARRPADITIAQHYVALGRRYALSPQYVRGLLRSIRIEARQNEN